MPFKRLNEWRSTSTPGIGYSAVSRRAGSARAAIDPGSPKTRTVDFNRDVRPILAKNCFACHGQDEAKRAKGLRLDRREAAVKPLKSGETAIVPGDPDSSELILRITEEDETLRMPPRKTGNRLTPAEVEVLKRWIEQGAEYAPHWALIAPKALPLPEVRDKAWPRNGIDFWILARLEKEGLKPSPEADRYTLLRRVSLDLRGLPPTLARSRTNSSQDHGPGRLREGRRPIPRRPGLRRAMGADVARPGPLRRFGRLRLGPAPAQHLAVPRLGHRRLQPQPALTTSSRSSRSPATCCPIRPSNERIATAFHRNTMTNTEGGTDDEEFRVAAIKDRVDTTMQVWMGLTMGCAKCHSHKFDPITHEEYYQFYAIFNQTADNDQPDESPVIRADAGDRRTIRRIDAGSPRCED